MKTLNFNNMNSDQKSVLADRGVSGGGSKMKNNKSQVQSVAFSAAPRAPLAALLTAALVFAALGGSVAKAADTSTELDSLGSNQDIVRRANQLDSRSRVGVVQGREVDRNWRPELGVNYGPVAGGSSLVNTQFLGVEGDLHITPQFSVGVRYATAFNQLTQEANQLGTDAQQAANNGGTYNNLPQINTPNYEILGLVDWYMFYGKINFFDIKTIQFDIYSLAGGGTINLNSSTGGDFSSPTWTAGGGIGFWLTNHLTSRFEVRYQNYTDEVYTGSRSMNMIAANVGFGVLL